VVKPPLRTKTLGTKVSEEEFTQLEAAASERGLTLSEWCRKTLLASVNGQGEKSADSGRADQALFARSIMAELAGGPLKPFFGLSGDVLRRKLVLCLGDSNDSKRPGRLTS
jgi:hypothetical protein